MHQSQKKFALSSDPAGLMKSLACLGAEVLMKLLGNYCRNIDVKTSITVGVVGEHTKTCLACYNFQSLRH